MTYKFLTGSLRPVAVLATFAMASVIGTAHATPVQLVTNGSFEVNGGTGELGYNTSATGWTSSSTTAYNFIFAPGTADVPPGAIGTLGGVQIYGPGDSSPDNGFKLSPDGGYFVALNSDINNKDNAFTTGPISQTLTGLTAGKQYTVSFYWAAAQQFGFLGATTEQLIVGFGAQTKKTPVLDNPEGGFTGWDSQSFTFTADGPSDVLSFLGDGNPVGTPPFALLDGVSVVATTPEPTSLALMLTGFAGVGGMVRSRFKK